MAGRLTVTRGLGDHAPLFGRHNGRGPGGQRDDAIHGKPVFGIDHLIARPGIGLNQKLQYLVTANATDDPCGIQPMCLGNGCAQFRMVGRRVTVHFMGRARDRVTHFIAGTKRILVLV